MRKKLSKEFKESCMIVGTVWLITLAVAAQIVVSEQIVADLYSACLTLSAVFVTVGRW